MWHRLLHKNNIDMALCSAANASKRGRRDQRGVKFAKMILITNSCLVRRAQVFASSAAPLLQFGFLFSWRRRAGASEICVKSFR